MLLCNNETIRGDISACFQELAIQDVYRFRRFKQLDAIIDIGANVGAFSMLARCNHPAAKVVMVEPQREVYEQLEPLAEALQIHLSKAAYGSCQWLEPNRYYKTMVYAEQKSDSCYQVDNCSMRDIVEQYQIAKDDRLFVKLDCEGGEAALLDDPFATEVLEASAGFGVEIHYSGKKAGFSHLPPFEQYRDYFDKLSRTHVIGYNGRSGNGHGIYTGVAKWLAV